MLVQKVPVTILKIDNKSGKAKRTGNAYSFFVATVIDEDSNVFKLNLADSLSDTAEKVKALSEVKNEEVEATIKFSPKQFDIAGTILDFA
jgi:hypothetical protein